jgi:hypothetical protein
MDEDRRSIVSDVTSEANLDDPGTDAADRVKVAVRVRPFTDAEVSPPGHIEFWEGTRCGFPPADPPLPPLPPP